MTACKRLICPAVFAVFAAAVAAADIPQKATPTEVAKLLDLDELAWDISSPTNRLVYAIQTDEILERDVLATDGPNRMQFIGRTDYASGGTTMNLGLLMGMRPKIVNLNGELAELLVFRAALDDEARKRIEDYLRGKYALGD